MMNNIFPDIPQVLVPLSLAPTAKKSKKINNNKEKNQQNPKNAKKASKSESKDYANPIEDQLKFNQNFMNHNMTELVGNQSQQSCSNQMPIQKTQRAHTVFSHSASTTFQQETNFKKPFTNENNKPAQTCVKKEMLQSKIKSESKMKMSASQPAISGMTGKNNNNNNNNQSNKMFQNTIYDNYWSPDEVTQGLEKQTLQQGQIRINQRSYEDSFLNDPVGFVLINSWIL